MFCLHNYGKIYKQQGLYEQIFYGRLKRSSPKKIGDIPWKVCKKTMLKQQNCAPLILGQATYIWRKAEGSGRG